MRAKDLVLAVLAILLVLWLGGTVLGMVNRLMWAGVRLAALVAVIAIIVHLAAGRRRY